MLLSSAHFPSLHSLWNYQSCCFHDPYEKCKKLRVRGWERCWNGTWGPIKPLSILALENFPQVHLEIIVFSHDCVMISDDDIENTGSALHYCDGNRRKCYTDSLDLLSMEVGELCMAKGYCLSFAMIIPWWWKWKTNISIDVVNTLVRINTARRLWCGL